MNCNSSNDHTTPRERGDRQSESVVVFRAEWHRPAITIIDLRRTMSTKGGYFADGPSGTSP